MTPPARRCIARLTLAAVLLVAITVTGSAQLPVGGDEKAGELISREDGQKTYLFRSLLKFAGLEPLKSFPRPGEAGDVVLVLFGTIDRDTAGRSQEVLARGGAVLIATEQRTDLNGFFPQRTILRILDRPVAVANPTGDLCFEGIADMPFLTDPQQPVVNPDVAKMVALKRVATNRPGSFYLPIGLNLGYLDTPLALFPQGTRHSGGGPPRLELPFAALMNNPANDPARSVAVVYTDAGIFTNQMLMARGTDNFAYTYFLARYLTTGPTGDRKRTKCLFVENGDVKTDFDASFLSESQLPPLPPPPFPSLEQLQDKLTDAGNAALDEVQTRDVLGRGVANNFDRIAPVLAVLAAVFAAVILLGRTWAARHHPDFTTPPPSGPDPDGSPLDHRRQEVLRSNDVYEPLREHLRGMFARWGRPDGGPDLPPVEAAGGPADRKLLLAKLRKLWEIAYGGTPVVIPFIRWKELEPMIESVTAAADAGRWRFARPGGEA